MNPVFKGAIASAISSASALVLSLPVVDFEHFSPWTLHGLVHLAEAIVAVIVIGEARFWKQWADEILGPSKP